MSRVIEMRLDDQTTFFAEVDDHEQVARLESAPISSDGVHLASAASELSAGITSQVANGLSSVRPVVGKVLESLRALSPDECQVEFGLKLSGEVGVFLTKGSAETTLKVTMKWKALPAPTTP